MVAAGWLPFRLPSRRLSFLWAPAGFRLTCYYYRGAYYKAFWADPPNCAVGEPRKGYIGESNWPLKIMNIHRFFFYLAALFIVMLTIDAIMAFRFKVGDHHEFGIGIGTIVLCANAFLLGGYTFGCHSCRHLIGGRADCISTEPSLCSKGLQSLQRAQQTAHALGVDEPGRGRLSRHLKTHVLDGNLETRSNHLRRAAVSNLPDSTPAGLSGR